MKNNLKICSITPPQFGYKQHELMQDIAISVGANYKSDLDESLESKSDDGVEIEVSNGKKRKPTLIKFKKTNKE